MPIVYLLSLFIATDLVISEIVQDEYFQLQGKLIDASTMKPIGNAHIFYSDFQTISDDKGEFSIRVKENTVLYISHIGYEKATYITSGKKEGSATVFLTPSSLELEEVIVRSLPNEQAFKQKVIAAKTPFHLQEELLKSNLQFIKKIHHLGYRYDMNSYDKLISSFKNNGSALLFSSNPSMGILGLIRRLKQRRTIPSKTRVSNNNSYPLYPYLRKKEGFQKYFE